MDVEAVRKLFPITRQWIFLNHAGTSPLSLPVVEAMAGYAEGALQDGGIGSRFYQRVEEVRRSAARLLNAEPAEITFIKNTTEGLIWVANGLDWQAGDNVVTIAIEFPANIYPWMALSARGVELRMVQPVDGRLSAASLEQAMDERTRVLTISAVQFTNGFRADLAELGRICRRRGVLFCVDAIQMLGALPIDVQAMNIDFLAADGHKWVCGPLSCGVFYIRRELIARLQPVLAGWLCMRNPLDFEHYDFSFVDSACKFDTGSYNVVGIYGLGAALDLVRGVGIEQIGQRVLMLTDRLAAGLRDKGYEVASPRGADEASGILSFSSPHRAAAALRDELERDHQIYLVVRDGRLRASPHYYQTPEEIDALVAALPDAV